MPDALRFSAQYLEELFDRRGSQEASGWPENNGHTFQDVAANLANNGDELMQLSKNLLEVCGLIDANAAAEDVLATAATLKAGIPDSGSFNTPILAWNMAKDSFWKPPAMSEVLPIAKSILLTRFREDPLFRRAQNSRNSEPLRSGLVEFGGLP